MPTIDNKKYFKSKDVKVFPCSFRGNYTVTSGVNSGQSYAFDPESRLNTEYNFTHLHSVGDNKSSYVIAFDKDILYCVIGGYYFEISNISTYMDDIKNKIFAIKLNQIDLKVDADDPSGAAAVDSDRVTYVLKSWSNLTEDLDGQDEQNIYRFYGLAIVSESDEDLGELALYNVFNSNGELNYENIKPAIEHGTGNHSIVLSENKYNEASGLYTVAQGIYTKASGEYSVTNGKGEKQDTTFYYTEADGDYSHAEGHVTKAGGNYAHTEGEYTRAEGKGSHAEGLGDTSLTEINWVNADGDYSHTEGLYTVARGEGAHAEGENTEAIGKASHTGGLGTKTTKDYSTIIGKYNEDVDGEFIIGIGTADNDRDNELVVDNKTTTIKNTLKVITDNNATKFLTEPLKTEITTPTNTIKGLTNEIKTADGHGLKIVQTRAKNKLSGPVVSYKTTLSDDDITINAGDEDTGAYIKLKKETGILVSYSTESYDPNEVIEDDTVKIAGENLKLNSETTTINAINSITLNTCDDAESTSPIERVKINTSATNITNTSLILNGTSIAKIQQNGNDRFVADNSGTGIFDDPILIKASDGTNESSIKLENNQITIKGPITTNSTLNVGGTATVNGDIVFGTTEDGTIGKIVYEPIGEILTTKKTDAQKGRVYFGGGDTTVVSGGENSKDAMAKTPTSFDTRSVYINSDSITQINTGVQTDWAKRKAWTFNTDGTLNCPNTIKMSYSGNAKLISANMNNDTEVAITAGFVAGGEKGSITLLTNNILTGTNSHISPIYVKQQVRGSTKHTITLLDQSGNTIFPGSLTAKNFSAGSSAAGIYMEKGNQINFSSSSTTLWFGRSKHGSYKINKYVFCSSNDTAGSTYSYGDIEAGTFNALSDIRLKENIIEYKPEKSILDLPVYKFDFINGTKNQIGCLAQDLQKICPEIVHEDETGYLSIQESKLIYLLLDEVKKLKQELKSIKGK